MSVHVTFLTDPTTAHDAAADAALVVLGHGFAEDWGNTGSPWGHHTLADVNAVTLLNLGEVEVSERFRESFGEATLTGTFDPEG